MVQGKGEKIPGWGSCLYILPQRLSHPGARAKSGHLAFKIIMKKVKILKIKS